MRKKISISETENDNFRLRERFTMRPIHKPSLSPSRTHQSLYCVYVDVAMMMMTKMPMLTKFEISLKSDLVVSS